MISFSEVVKRALTGPICSERDFELKVLVPAVRQAVKEYGVQYDIANPVPADDDLADRVWEAGLDVLCETGVYCPDTERRIVLSRDEIDSALEAGPRGEVFGEGTDAKAMPRRRPEGDTPPWCSVGAGGGPVSSEQLVLSLVKAYAENPLADSVTAPSLARVDGQLVVAGSPLEIEAAIRTMLMAREGLRRAGRPGMPIVNAVSSAVRAAGHIAGHRFGVRTTDALEIGSIHEMKVDFDSLNKVAYSLACGSLIYGENGVILGGLAGGPAGTAVVTAAYNLVDLLILRAAVQHPFPTHFDLRTTSTRDTIWARNLANQAASRNSPLPIVNIGYAGAGPMTKQVFYEFCAWVIGCVVSGGSIEVGGSAKGVVVDHTSPMEPLLASEVAHAVAGMSRTEANEIVKGLLAKYEENLQEPPEGQRYQDCFDVETGTPSREFVELYKEVKREMVEEFGLQLRPMSVYG